MKASLFFDGASRGNPGQAGAGAYILYQSTHISLSKPLGKQTNNYAEYSGLLVGLEYIITNPEIFSSLSQLEIKGDSQLVIYQLQDKWKLKSPNLSQLFNQCKLWISQLEKSGITIKLIHIPRNKNKMADQLANQGADSN